MLSNCAARAAAWQFDCARTPVLYNLSQLLVHFAAVEALWHDRGTACERAVQGPDYQLVLLLTDELHHKAAVRIPAMSRLDHKIRTMLTCMRGPTLQRIIHVDCASLSLLVTVTASVTITKSEYMSELKRQLQRVSND